MNPLRTSAPPQTAKAAPWAYGAFFAGLLLGLLLLAGVVWVNFEARMFYPWDVMGKRRTLTGLWCPPVAARDEVIQLRIRVTNPTQRPVRRFLRVTATLGHVLLVDQGKEWLDLAPGETRTVQWAIPASQAAYGGRFLLVSAYLGAAGSLPAAQNDCGIWVWPVRGVSATALLALAFGLAFGLMAAGLFVGNLGPAWPTARLLFGLYLVAWLVQIAARAWVGSALVLALLALSLLLLFFQSLQGPDADTV